MKKITLTILCFTLAFVTYAQKKAPAPLPAAGTQTSKYLPIEDQIIYKGNILGYNAADGAVSVDVNTVKHDTSFLKLFTKTLSTVSIFAVDANGNLSIAGNNGVVDKGNYHVIYEYSLFQPVNYNRGDTALTYCVGISIRLTANITTYKSNVDLSKIIGLSASGGTSKFSGQLQLSLSGINSQALTNLCPITPNGATFTSDNVATSLQAIAAIKSHFFDRGVTITPMVIGFYETSNSTGPQGKNSYAEDIRLIKQKM